MKCGTFLDSFFFQGEPLKSGTVLESLECLATLIYKFLHTFKNIPEFPENFTVGSFVKFALADYNFVTASCKFADFLKFSVDAVLQFFY